MVYYLYIWRPYPLTRARAQARVRPKRARALATDNFCPVEPPLEGLADPHKGTGGLRQRARPKPPTDGCHPGCERWSLR